ncbi:hypothetical protein SAMN05444172_9031 [Burkholderia sp. GAS332]|nr:hypothetical protein SAMN05444172_9031 [Burkholderia sp. GAS332]
MLTEKAIQPRDGANRHLMATVKVAITLSAYPGGGGADGVVSGTDSQSGSLDASSTQAGFFDSIFVNGSGSGYYQFGANFGGASGKPTATGRTQFYLSGDSDINFTETTGVIVGSYQQQYVDGVYITEEGAFTSRSTRYTDIGSGSRIFQKLPQGYQFGMNGMTSPLYDVTLTSQDVSGQPVGQALEADNGPSTNGLLALLGNDTTRMPAGAVIFQSSEKMLTTHRLFNLGGKNAGG